MTILIKNLDTNLDQAIDREEYAAKKQKLLNRKVEIGEEIENSGRKRLNRLELFKKWILNTHKSKFIRGFIKKFAQNPYFKCVFILVEKRFHLSPAGATFPVEFSFLGLLLYFKGLGKYQL